MVSYLDFEKPVAELEAKVEELRAVAARGGAVSIGEELTKLETKAAKALADLYRELTPWQKTLVARHPQRPRFLDYVKGLITEFTPLAGDRQFAEDAASRADMLAFYAARNEAGQPVSGVSTYNVTPERAGKYFHKTACFCFTDQPFFITSTPLAG